MHRCRDVTFHADATKLTQGQAGRVMAALNNLVLGLLRLASETNLAAARRRHTADLGCSVALLTKADRRTESPPRPSSRATREAGPAAP